jgi:predicted DsbA family dithiol-disulfide isomerase
MAGGMAEVEITYFSDLLCVWAYISQARIDAIKEKFGDSVLIKHRFCSVFGDTADKISSNWKDKGAYEGFNAHLRHVAERFSHVRLHSELWLTTRPASSSSPHLFMKAVQQWEEQRQVSAPKIIDEVAWALRSAFFRDCKDISAWEVQCEVARHHGVDIDAVEKLIRSGAAFARLSADYREADKLRIEGSPSLVLNEGRQKLYGNIGFRLIQANIQELLHEPRPDDASWC